jgi:hypothetical protein
MLAGLLQQVEAWTGELQALETRLASTPAPENAVRDELLVNLETLAAQRSSLRARHAELPLPAQETRPVSIALQALCLTTATGLITESNTDAGRLFNFPTPWLIGEPLVVFVATDERRTFLQKLVNFKFHHTLALQAEWHLNLQPVNGEAFRAVVNISKTLDHHDNVLRLAWLVRPLRYNLL